MLKYKHFPDVKTLPVDSITDEVYKYLHNLESEVVELKLNLATTSETFIHDEAFLAGKLAILQELLSDSPFNREE